MKEEKYEVLLKVMPRWEIDAEKGTVKTREGIKKKTDTNGYIIVSTTYKGKKYYFKAHQVIVVFAGLYPVGMTINHLNGIKTDNRIENLEIVTSKENTIHAYKTGLAKAHNKTPEDVTQYILDSYDGSFSFASRMAKELNLNPETIRRITSDKRKERLEEINQYIQNNYDGSHGCIARISKELNVERTVVHNRVKKKVLV